MADTETPFQQELGQEDLADPRESQAVHREHPSAKEYIRIGIILAVLIGTGHLPTGSEVPLWVVLSAHTAIALGTLTGGWRIVKTMGSRITKLQPVGGVAAESAAAATLFFTSYAGIPVSTTHTITGSIVGVGASRRLSAVRWGVAGNIVWAWILTIPAAGTLAALSYVVVGIIWPQLPLIGQWLLGAAVAAGLAYSLIVWLKSAKAGKLAHA